jgi:CRP/FNR family transcriptional regulator, anaerobic regulatory protein
MIFQSKKRYMAVPIFDSLLENFTKHIALSDAEQTLLRNSFLARKIKRKQYFIHPHQRVTEVAFVINGCLRSYAIDNNGFEHILQFAPENWWITDMAGFISGGESQLSVDAILDTEVLVLTRQKQVQLFDTIPQLEKFFRILTENALISSRQRVLENLSFTAMERYTNFCKTYPTLIHSLPQKQIAAYIGVTPEFLSKLKKSTL